MWQRMKGRGGVNVVVNGGRGGVNVVVNLRELWGGCGSE